MNPETRAVLDYFMCASMEAVEELHEAIAELQRELLGEDGANGI